MISRPKDAVSNARSERLFIGLVREGQMSTVLPRAAYLSDDELRIILSLAAVALRATSPVAEAPSVPAGAELDQAGQGSLQATVKPRDNAAPLGKPRADAGWTPR
jgi:hypothetical protein